jgi:AcrR family transcriptional regulator
VPTSSHHPKPHGRDQVRTAVLAATRDLVAERGPDGFSVREIAARAGVNHALVHRHFGTKSDVLKEMLAMDAAAVVAAITDAGLPTRGAAGADVVTELLEVLAARPSYWRALVHAVLDSPQAAVPGTAATTDLFSGLWSGAEPDRAVSTSVAAVTTLGWLVFGRFVTDAIGGDAQAVRRAVAEQISALASEPD